MEPQQAAATTAGRRACGEWLATRLLGWRHFASVCVGGTLRACVLGALCERVWAGTHQASHAVSVCAARQLSFPLTLSQMSEGMCRTYSCLACLIS